MCSFQARVQGEGAKGPGPPLEIGKKKVTRANFKLFHLYFATFFSLKYRFFQLFSELAPPLKK